MKMNDRILTPFARPVPPSPTRRATGACGRELSYLAALAIAVGTLWVYAWQASENGRNWMGIDGRLVTRLTSPAAPTPDPVTVGGGAVVDAVAGAVRSLLPGQ